MALQMHPNVMPLFGQAQVAARGRNPVLMLGANHTLISYNAWMHTTLGYRALGVLQSHGGWHKSHLAGHKAR